MLEFCYCLLILDFLMIRGLGLTPNEIEAQRSGWNVNPKTQYHIQTDDGLERYFKFQTLNGQFRKEKRLEDGTVIGTEGWLDPAGYLRIKDYIADHNGFRIIRSKMIFVGRNQAIGDAIAIGKRVPSKSGTFIETVRPPNPFRQSTFQGVSDDNVVERTGDVRRYQNRDKHNYLTSSSNLPSSSDSRTESIHYGVQEKTFPNYRSRAYHRVNLDKRPFRKFSRPSLEIERPINDIYKNNDFQQGHSRIYSPESTPYPFKSYSNQTIEPISSNSLNNKYEIGGYGNLNKKNLQYIRAPLVIDHDHNFPEYDGIHTLADGFQYYLKTHYHEEQQKSDHNIGSFGYIDPFGIRRVIYYKADRNNGYLQKQNNRYVGPDATPYDPMPHKTL